MSDIPKPCNTALVQADELLLELRPIVAQMIERNDPAVEKLTFSDIEGNAAAVGDLLAKAMMLRALERQGIATDAETQAARNAVLQKAGPRRGKQLKPDDLQMTRIPKRSRTLKTARGEIAFSREYLYFPELKSGIFPPGNATGDSQ
jgi:hypothetical protein